MMFAEEIQYIKCLLLVSTKVYNANASFVSDRPKQFFAFFR